MPAELLNFVSSLGQMALCGFLYGLFAGTTFPRLFRNLILGTLFGLAAYIAMLEPINLSDGVFVDNRNVLLAFAGACFGPLGAAVALLIACMGRLAIGGVGAHAGIATMVLSTAAGLAWSALPWQRDRTSLLSLLALGAMSSLGIVGTVLLPSDLFLEFLRSGSPYFIAYNMFGAIVLGWFIGREHDNAQRILRLTGEASVDALTGLPNRRALERRYVRKIDRSRFQGTALMAIDLDHFKLINDRHGHHVGDRVLSASAAIITSCLRPSDMAVRYGGEEFVVLAENISEQDAGNLAHNIRSAFERKQLRFDGVEVDLTASLGVFWGPDKPDLAEALSSADSALYMAKARGRNRVERAE